MIYLIFITSVVLIQCTSAASLPPSVKICSRNDKELDKCITAAIAALRPYLAQGDLGGGFKTIPVEPLSLPDVSIGNGPEFQASFTDLIAHGGSNVVTEKFKSNITALEFSMLGLVPKIDFGGRYNLKMKILGVEIKGDGDLKGSFRNVREIWKIRGSTYKKDGKDFLRFDKMSMKIQVKPDSVALKLDNLFNGDPVLSEVGNNIVNTNQDLYLSEIIPILEKSLSKQFLELANSIIKDVTFDELFPIN